MGNSKKDEKEDVLKGTTTKKHQIFIVTSTFLALLGVLIVTVGTNASGQHVMSSAAAAFEMDEGALIMDMFGSYSEKVRKVGQYGKCTCISDCNGCGPSCCDDASSNCPNFYDYNCNPRCG